MDKLYVKCVLHAYPNLESIKEQIDELMEKKAFSSMMDVSPAEQQCVKMVGYIFQKDILNELKILVDRALENFTTYQLDCFDYKYFKLKDREYYKDFDAKSRGYFRTQNKLVDLFSQRAEKVGLNDEWFKENCLQLDFFKELLKRVKERENAIKKQKNQP
jgi:hypothetical protein